MLWLCNLVALKASEHPGGASCWLIATTGSNLAPGWYLMAAALVSLIAVSLAAETSRQPLRHD